MRGTSPREILGAFEKFLSTIPLEQYRSELQQIKTVEQDLPRDLNPLPDIYEAYWRQESPDFPSYEDFFESWWVPHRFPLYNEKWLRSFAEDAV